MTTSGPRSGKDGCVDGIPQVRNWNLNILGQVETRIHSASACGPERYPGVEDWNVTIEGFGGCPTFWVGDYVALDLFCGPDDGVRGNAGLHYIGDAIVDRLAITWDWAPTRSLGWSATLSAHGCLSYASDTWLLDESTECVDRMCSLFLSYGEGCGSGGVTPMANVTNAVLTFICNNQVVVNSSTDCCTERIPGTYDWTLDITQQEDYYDLLNSANYAFKLYNSATTYWMLEWGILNNVSNIRVDIETGAVKSKTYNVQMNGRMCCGSASSNIGYIVDPLGATLWPFAIAP